MTPLVSILIPSFNAGAWLHATLESALAQTWPRCEIIVVDDGSTDDSPAIARNFAARGVRLLTQRNAGQSAAFNLAMREARGDFLEFLDADDLLAPDKIERQVRLLAQHPPDTICAGAWARFRSDPAEASFKPEPVWRDLDPVDWLVTSWEGGGMMHGAAWLVPTAVARHTGPWNESLTLTNDFDYFTRVLLAGSRVVFCAEARTYYRSGHAASVSGTRSRAALQSAFTSIELGTAALLRRHDDARTRHASAASFQRFVHTYYPSCPDIMAAAERHIRSLGGCDLAPEGGDAFLALSRLVGWKLARRAQRFAQRVLRR
ncbi:MAG TPA: glycosyltransferase family A protein [Opitutus sp.]|nr:glycosyltransferase family A protein [Opitutus sp.]